MPRHQVDRAALSEDRIRDLGLDQPTDGDQHPRDRGAQRGVRLVRQSIDRAATPANRDHHLRVVGREHAAQTSKGDAVQVAPFDQGNEALAHVGALADIDLAKPQSMSECSSYPADLRVVHLAMLRRTAHLWLI